MMQADATVPLGTILDKMADDADLAAALASEVSEILRPREAAHLALLQAHRDLADRLAARRAELQATADAVGALSDALESPLRWLMPWAARSSCRS